MSNGWLPKWGGFQNRDSGNASFVHPPSEHSDQEDDEVPRSEEVVNTPASGPSATGDSVVEQIADAIADNTSEQSAEAPIEGASVVVAPPRVVITSPEGESASETPEERNEEDYRTLRGGKSILLPKPVKRATMATDYKAPGRVFPWFGGHLVGTVYVTSAGKTIEEFDVLSWIERVEADATTIGMKDDDIVAHAARSLPHNSPAGQWFQLKKDACNTWAKLKKGLMDAFARPMSAQERADMINNTKQMKGERAHDFMVRLSLKARTFFQGMESHLTEDPFAAHTAEQKKTGKLYIDAAKAYVLQSLFVAGLRADFRTHITEQGVHELSAMLELCNRCEIAESAAHPNSLKRAIGAVDAEDDPPKHDQLMTREEVDKLMSAKIAAFSSNREKKGKPNTASKKDKDKPVRNVDCYYCFAHGHYSNKCTVKQADNAKGWFRPHVKHEKMTKDDYDKLSPEEKTSGKAICEARKAAAQQKAQSGQQAYSAVVNAGPPPVRAFPQQSPIVAQPGVVQQTPEAMFQAYHAYPN